MALRPSTAYGTLQLMMPSLAPVYQRRAAILLEQRKNQAAVSEKTEEESEQPNGDMKAGTLALFRRFIRWCKPAPTAVRIEDEAEGH